MRVKELQKRSAGEFSSPEYAAACSTIGGQPPALCTGEGGSNPLCRRVHSEQARTEMACYENSLGKVKMMMKKNTFYQFSPEFQKIQADVEKYLER